MQTLWTRSPQMLSHKRNMFHGHICLLAAVDLGMTLLQANLFFSVPHSFSVYFLWGDFPYQYHSSSFVWKEVKSVIALLFALLLT